MQVIKQGNQIKFDRISHAYIADELTASSLCAAVVCEARGRARPCLVCSHCDKALRGIHPDITVISKASDKRDILVDQVREIRRDVYIMPNEALQKVYLIEDADLMNTGAQNALLQVLEEPPPHAVFVLKVSNPSTLLPTIRSRCAIIGRSDGGEHETLRHSDDDSGLELVHDFVSALGRDDVALMRCMFQIEKLDRATLLVFFTGVREQIALSLREPGGASSVRSSLIRSEELLTKAEEMLNLNVNAGHISGMICAELVDS